MFECKLKKLEIVTKLIIFFFMIGVIKFLKKHIMFNLNTTTLNRQRSHYDPTDNGYSSLINLGNGYSPIDIEGFDSGTN